MRLAVIAPWLASLSSTMAGFGNGFPVGLGERGEEIGGMHGWSCLLEHGSEDGFYRRDGADPPSVWGRRPTGSVRACLAGGGGVPAWLGFDIKLTHESRAGLMSSREGVTRAGI